MENKIKSGKEIVDDFFKNLPNLKDADKDIVNSLIALYEKKKLSDTNIKTELNRLRRIETK